MTNDKTCFAEGADWSIIAVEGTNPEEVRKRRAEELYEGLVIVLLAVRSVGYIVGLFK